MAEKLTLECGRCDVTRIAYKGDDGFVELDDWMEIRVADDHVVWVDGDGCGNGEDHMCPACAAAFFEWWGHGGPASFRAFVKAAEERECPAPTTCATVSAEGPEGDQNSKEM
jgi:hypothetical protein